MTHQPLRHLGETNGGGPSDAGTLLDLYLDGALSAEEAARFEAHLEHDGDLRAQLDAQRRIDASLRASFAVPASVPVSTEASTHTGVVESTRSKSILSRIGWLRIAAVIAIAALAGIVFGTRYFAATAYPTESPIVAYQSIVQGGFRPYEVCTDDAEFEHYTQKYLGKALRVESMNGLALVGWDNRHNVLSIETDALLATVNGTQVVVFMDKAEHARRLPSKGEGLNVFKREYAGVALVEVSPLAEPKILPRFREAKDCEPGGVGEGKVIRRGY